MKVKVGVSNRHIHLSMEDKNILFGDDYILREKEDYHKIIIMHAMKQLI